MKMLDLQINLGIMHIKAVQLPTLDVDIEMTYQVCEICMLIKENNEQKKKEYFFIYLWADQETNFQTFLQVWIHY